MHPEAETDGACFVARLLAGAPSPSPAPPGLSAPWAGLIQAIVQVGPGERLPAFEKVLSELPGNLATEIRTRVGRAGRAILRGPTPQVLATPEFAGTDVPELPQTAQLPPDLQGAGGEAGSWLTDYVAYAAGVSERTPRLFHEAIGLWTGSLAIARRLRLRLRHGDIYPNLYVLGVASTTLYAKSTALDVGSRLIHESFPHLLFANDFTPEAMLADLAGREPVNLNSADLTERDRDLWLQGRHFAAQRGFIAEEASALLAGLRRDYMTGMAELLLRLYDCPDLYRRNTRGAGFIVVRKAYLSIIGMTTPARLQGSVGSRDVRPQAGAAQGVGGTDGVGRHAGADDHGRQGSPACRQGQHGPRSVRLQESGRSDRSRRRGSTLGQANLQVVHPENAQDGDPPALDRSQCAAKGIEPAPQGPVAHLVHQLDPRSRRSICSGDQGPDALWQGL